MPLRIKPLSLRDANEWVTKHHRHSKKSRGHKFSISVELDGVRVGVAIAGRPVSRVMDDGDTLEVLRVCTLGTPNACSKLYGAARRAAFAMGYTKVITYTLASESGASLRAAGFVQEASVKGGRQQQWLNRPDSIRTGGDPRANVDKVRWSSSR